MYTIIHFHIGVDANDIQTMIQQFTHNAGEYLCFDDSRRRLAVRVDDRTAFATWSMQYKSVIARIESVNTPLSVEWSAMAIRKPGRVSGIFTFKLLFNCGSMQY